MSGVNRDGQAVVARKTDRQVEPYNSSVLLGLSRKHLTWMSETSKDISHLILISLDCSLQHSDIAPPTGTGRRR